MRVVEMVCSISKGVDFELCHEVLRDFLQEPIDNHATFDTALAMENEDYFCKMGFVERFFDGFIAVSDIVGSIVKVALNEALDYIKEYAVAEWC